MDELIEFRDYRKRMNEKIFAMQNKNINRIFAIDSGSYREGALSAKIKELIGLATSLVLRCEDCIKYHMIKVVQEKCTDDEIAETLAIGLVVGGSITVPEIRRVVDILEQLREKESKGESLEDLL
ncbi:MAG: carboxymuconolactone decarboxylase family protein [Candidatus Heimdallarchaeota archaeon]|nr:carboxymuconolactone decarboxylase family protein [Candidatus Heimdallarchaeota archaeon]